MIEDNEDQEVVENAPAPNQRFPVIIVLSVLLALAVCAGSAVGYLGFRENARLQAELAVAREEVQRKTTAVEDLGSQIEDLSKQMSALKDYSVARSLQGGSAAKATAVKPLPPMAPEIPGLAPPQATADGQRAKTTEAGVTNGDMPTPAKEKKAKVESQNCELVGKTPEEQAATLKRCVGLMEGVSEKPRVAKPAEKRR